MAIGHCQTQLIGAQQRRGLLETVLNLLHGHLPAGACLCAGDKERCPWLSMPLSTAYAVVHSLLESVGHVQGTDQSTEDSKAEVLGQILAHSMLGRKVCRADCIMRTGPNEPNAVAVHVPLCQWQDAENAGFCSLVRTGEHSS